MNAAAVAASTGSPARVQVSVDLDQLHQHAVVLGQGFKQRADVEKGPGRTCRLRATLVHQSLAHRLLEACHPGLQASRLPSGGARDLVVQLEDALAGVGPIQVLRQPYACPCA